MKPKDWIKLLVTLAVCEGAGLVGAWYTIPAIPGWYASLHKAAVNPPSWVFGPIWTILYALMAVAALLIWQQTDGRKFENKHGGGRAVLMLLVIFLTQLELNVFWSVIFFGFKDPQAAFMEILLLWIDILVTIIAFSRFSKCAAWLLVPYLAWVTFAAYLNFAVWQLNPILPAAMRGPASFSARVPLPAGYSLDRYTVEKRLPDSCQISRDCRLPMEYAVQSRCPFAVVCLQNKCAVVCPGQK